MLEGRGVQTQKSTEYANVECIFSISSAKIVPFFFSSNHFLYEDLKQKPIKNFYFALWVIAKHFIGTARGLVGSIFEANLLCRHQNLCCQSESGTILINEPFDRSHHCWKGSCHPSCCVKIILVSLSARSLTLKYIFLFLHVME